MSLKHIPFFLTALALSACATTSSSISPTSLEYGAKPSVDEQSIESYMAGLLKDAESARYSFDEPVKAYCQGGALSGGKVLWSGWVIPFKVNAKNSYGGYVGFKPYVARYNDDGLMDVSEPYHVTWDFVPTVGTGCKFVDG